MAQLHSEAPHWTCGPRLDANSTGLLEPGGRLGVTKPLFLMDLKGYKLCDLPRLLTV